MSELKESWKKVGKDFGSLGRFGVSYSILSYFNFFK